MACPSHVVLMVMFWFFGKFLLAVSAMCVLAVRLTYSKHGFFFFFFVFTPAQGDKGSSVICVLFLNPYSRRKGVGGSSQNPKFKNTVFESKTTLIRGKFM